MKTMLISFGLHSVDAGPWLRIAIPAIRLPFPKVVRQANVAHLTRDEIQQLFAPELGRAA